MNHDFKLFLENGDILQYIIKYQTENSDMAAERYQRFLTRLISPRCVLPVAGIQGSGKSTLLSALLFDKPVMPIDADETTCVPVEVIWSANPSREAVVYYQDGREERIPADEENLKHIVHNGFNEGNEAGVNKVVVESENPVLRDGLVLVDLPGIGSITQANQKTTEAYLRDSVGVIFLLRTVPPLTKSETIFVKAWWKLLPSVLFVQNRWNDESQRECEEGKEHNIKVLKQSASEAHIPIDGDIKISVVNMYSAWRGVLTKNATEQKQSGLTDLAKLLQDFGRNWKDSLPKIIAKSIAGDIDELLRVIEERTSLYQSDTATIEKDILKIEQEYLSWQLDAKTKVELAQKETRSFIEGMKKHMDDWVKSEKPEIRNSMRSILRAGVVDGPRLTSALKDNQQSAYEDLHVELSDKIFEYIEKLKSKFGGVADWKHHKNFQDTSFQCKESIKIENIIPPIGSTGGGLAGGWGGFEVGALIGTACFPGIGTIIGGIAGALLGGLLGSWVGNWGGHAIKNGITEVRIIITEMEERLFKAIDAFFKATVADKTNILDNLQSCLKRDTDKWLAEQDREYQIEHSEKIKALKQGATERKSILKELTIDSIAVHAMLERVKGGLK